MLLFLTGCVRTEIQYKYYPLDPIYCQESIKNVGDVLECFTEYKVKYWCAIRAADGNGTCEVSNESLL